MYSNQFSWFRPKLLQFIDICKQNIHTIIVENCQAELYNGYFINKVTLNKIENVDIQIHPKQAHFELTIQELPIQVEISGFPISLMMQGLKINCEIYLDPNEFYVNALQITYNEFFMDSNFLVSYITSKLLSESMLSSLVLRAQDELSKIVYRAMYYNEDKIRPILGEWETQDPKKWFADLNKIKGIKLANGKLETRLDDVFKREKEDHSDL